jgi:hypothetical protein
MSRFTFERRGPATAVLMISNSPFATADGTDVRLRDLIADYQGAEVVLRLSREKVLVEILAINDEPYADTAGSIVEIVSEALPRSSHQALQALCRLLLADSRLNSLIASDKFAGLSRLRKRPPEGPVYTTVLSDEDSAMDFLESIERIHEDCEAVLARRCTGHGLSSEDWERAEKDFVVGIDNCASRLEAVAKSYVESRKPRPPR